MTDITLVIEKNGRYLKCRASGHAGFAEYGKDIVCSAVTILMRTAIQVFSETSGIEFETDTSLRGFLSFSAGVKKSDSVLQEKIFTIGNFLQKGFDSLSEEFPENVTFELKLED
ncbi:MAG: ribosomal-processing cysteine protease Prp [Spirochaetia bacterium]|nr:ribosomal-processing cysteine protease Prp [Spirochaetia bacterium]MDD7699057.1 ribosomal-processing cysteine protease Prp [Spirochaetia bacterium]MDY4210698.1 ribosomal-processing cysteine protease Prp [Treponema sp.]